MKVSSQRSAFGLVLKGAGVLLATDPIVDMGRTAVNVTGQMLVPYGVAGQEGLLDEEQPSRLGNEVVTAH